MNKRTAFFRWYNMTQKVLYITSHCQLQGLNLTATSSRGLESPNIQFSAVLLGQLSVHLSDLLLWPKGCLHLGSHGDESAGDICRAGAPEGARDPKTALVTQQCLTLTRECHPLWSCALLEGGPWSCPWHTEICPSAAWQSTACSNNTETHLSKRTQSSAEKWGVCSLNSHCNKHRMKHFNGLQLIIYKNCRFSMNLNCKLVINNTVSFSTF